MYFMICFANPSSKIAIDVRNSFPTNFPTIMASAGGHCEHVNHVSTQLPYAIVVAAVCMVGYLLIGILQAAKLAALSWLALPVCIVLLFVILMLIRAKTGREEV